MFEPEDFQGDVLPVSFSVNHARWFFARLVARIPLIYHTPGFRLFWFLGDTIDEHGAKRSTGLQRYYAACRSSEGHDGALRLYSITRVDTL